MDLQEAREQIVESYILRTKCTIEEAESFDEDVKKSYILHDLKFCLLLLTCYQLLSDLSCN